MLGVQDVFGFLQASMNKEESPIRGLGFRGLGV